MVQLQSGIGMKGGPDNPLGSRAMYLWSGNKDTLYRIHGTNEPWTIGTNVSSGCIRLTNEDIVDLYNRTPIGAKVVVFGAGTPLRNKAASSTGGDRGFAKIVTLTTDASKERFSPIP
jgi:L,D-transpeptidase catalytic domain